MVGWLARGAWLRAKARRRARAQQRWRERQRRHAELDLHELERRYHEPPPFGSDQSATGKPEPMDRGSLRAG
jgi:hypothetical protein